MIERSGEKHELICDQDRMKNYLKYRGRCREMSEALVKKYPALRLVRGWYYCPLWGKQAHWWTVTPKGKIIDPTKDQFPSGGCGDYVEYDGMVECAQCGRKMPETEAKFNGRFAFCKNTKCEGQFIGAIP
jgi:hypothetical protein